MRFTFSFVLWAFISLKPDCAVCCFLLLRVRICCRRGWIVNMTMLKFDEQKQIDSVAGALDLRGQIEEAVDTLCRTGCREAYYLGIGGTYASALQAEAHGREKSAFPVFAENAARYITSGNRRIGKGSAVVISSVTGTTPEMLEAVKRAKAAGALVLGFVDDAAAPLAGLVDFEIAYPGCEQLKFFMAADRFFWNNGDFPEYVEYHREMEQYLPRALAEAEKKADEFGKEFAQRHHADPIHYFVGAGSQYGAAYSYAMCYWEEQHWLRAKAVHAGEFFHGTLEIIDRDTPVTVFLGEDAERPLAERVANFLPRICGNFTLIDSRDYELAGIRPEYRGSLSHLVTHAVTQRIDAHIELLNRHPMEIRRYYRCLDY